MLNKRGQTCWSDGQYWVDMFVFEPSDHHFTMKGDLRDTHTHAHKQVRSGNIALYFPTLHFIRACIRLLIVGTASSESTEMLEQ